MRGGGTGCTCAQTGRARSARQRMEDRNFILGDSLLNEWNNASTNSFASQMGDNAATDAFDRVVLDHELIIGGELRSDGLPW